eukprot:TRINITY_DN11573_c0_g1_i1.p1 TRINITY_DN11573_c0_g1~~TRINITY_DN11573_c0_g1_i1.p1  ORF type:complete len:344 (-),score=119.44 TRINITY_DN11573_c0_g1_i1:39-1037(-)
MNPALAYGNKHLNKKWNDKNFQRHQARLKTVKSRLDNERPPSYIHLRQNAKRQQVEKERCDQIFKENQRLLTNIATIKSVGGSTIDTSVPKSTKLHPGSLNAESKRRRLSEIDKENSRLLGKISNMKSSYDVQDFKKHAQTQARYLKAISEYDSEDTINRLLGKDQKHRVLKSQGGKKENQENEEPFELEQQNDHIDDDNFNEANEIEQNNEVDEANFNDDADEINENNNLSDDHNNVVNEHVEDVSETPNTTTDATNNTVSNETQQQNRNYNDEDNASNQVNTPQETHSSESTQPVSHQTIPQPVDNNRNSVEQVNNESNDISFKVQNNST